MLLTSFSTGVRGGGRIRTVFRVYVFRFPSLQVQFQLSRRLSLGITRLSLRTSFVSTFTSQDVFTLHGDYCGGELHFCDDFVHVRHFLLELLFPEMVVDWLLCCVVLLQVRWKIDLVLFQWIIHLRHRRKKSAVLAPGEIKLTFGQKVGFMSVKAIIVFFISFYYLK